MRIIYGIKNTLRNLEVYLTPDEADRLAGFCMQILRDAELSEEKKFVIESWVQNGKDDLHHCSDCALFGKYYSETSINLFTESAREIIRKDPL